MGQLLAIDAFMSNLPMPQVPTRIYAGVGGLRHSRLPFGMEANDFILSVSEATGRFEAEALKVPSSHTYIMNSKLVFNDMAKTLETIAGTTHQHRVF
jgi:hypothetical protein